HRPQGAQILPPLLLIGEVLCGVVKPGAVSFGTTTARQQRQEDEQRSATARRDRHVTALLVRTGKTNRETRQNCDCWPRGIPRQSSTQIRCEGSSAPIRAIRGS